MTVFTRTSRGKADGCVEDVRSGGSVCDILASLMHQSAFSVCKERVWQEQEKTKCLWEWLDAVGDPESTFACMGEVVKL